MITDRLTPNALVTSARILAIGCSGVVVFKAIKKDDDLLPAFESIVIAALAIQFHDELLKGLNVFSLALSQKIQSLNPNETLIQFIAKSFQDAANKYSNNRSAHTGIVDNISNSTAFLGQVIRTGIWGVVTSIVDLLFMLIQFVFEVCRDVCIQILYVLLPLASGIYPVAPKILSNLATYALEISLWYPLFSIINVTTALIAKKYVTTQNDIGFFVLAVEIVAILLVVSIPSLTHRIISGALTSDGGSGLIFQGARQWFKKQWA